MIASLYWCRAAYASAWFTLVSAFRRQPVPDTRTATSTMNARLEARGARREVEEKVLVVMASTGTDADRWRARIDRRRRTRPAAPDRWCRRPAPRYGPERRCSGGASPDRS